jgi:N-acetylglucosaminyldiphosphoundecaprenol N-acetyl-beta-D-mannosaminyltransferase
MTVTIGKIPFRKITFQGALTAISELIMTGRRCHQVVVANTYSVYLAEKNEIFSQICLDSDIVFADGLPVVLGSRLLGNPLPERIAGPDFMWEMCGVCAQKGYKIFLLGGRQDSLDHLKANLNTAFPKLEIVGMYSPPFGKWDAQENTKIVEMINASEAELLWVGVSTPKQDAWIDKNKSHLNVKVAIAVGAAFDFHSGRIKRAPLWMQKYCLEWLHRFFQEPKRMWKRYLVANSFFVFILAKEIIKNRRKRNLP